MKERITVSSENEGTMSQEIGRVVAEEAAGTIKVGSTEFPATNQLVCDTRATRTTWSVLFGVCGGEPPYKSESFNDEPSARRAWDRRRETDVEREARIRRDEAEYRARSCG
jgi:hypothetical protein